MNELSDTKLVKPLDKSNLGSDTLALRELVNFVNNPAVTGAVVPPEARVSIDKILSTAPPPNHSPASAPQLPALPPKAIDFPVPLGRKLFFTGRLCAGKDYVAAAIGGSDVFGFADPIYSLAEYLLNIKVTATAGKDAPGVRKFLQTIGQWGRAEVSLQYPHTIERAMFALMVRSLANQNCCLGAGVEWGKFGLTTDLWIDGLLKRVECSQSNRICVTNCRFENEYRRLTEAGFQHWHIVCSSASWVARLGLRKLDMSSPVISDVSEKFAADLNADLVRKLSASRAGPRMRVIWSDDTPSPSPRIYSLDEFVSLAKT